MNRPIACSILLLIAFVAIAADAAAPKRLGRPPAVSAATGTLVPVWSRTVTNATFDTTTAAYSTAVHGNPFVLPVLTNTSEEAVGFNASTGATEYTISGSSFSVIETMGTAAEVVLVTWDASETIMRVRVFDRRSGTNLWLSAAVQDYPELTLSNGQLLWLNYPNTTGSKVLAAFDLRTGSVLWSKPHQGQEWTWAMCGPRASSSARYPSICIMSCVARSAFAIDAATGATKWTVANVAGTDIPLVAATGGAFGLFGNGWYVVIDAASGAVRANVTTATRVMVPLMADFGLFCSAEATAQWNFALRCVDATYGKVVFRQSVPWRPFPIIASKSTVLAQHASRGTGFNFTAWNIADGKALWSLTDLPGHGLIALPPQQASFFAVTTASGVAFYHYRTGTLIANLTGQPGVSNVFLADAAPGKIFVTVNGTLTAYALHA